MGTVGFCKGLSLLLALGLCQGWIGARVGGCKAPTYERYASIAVLLHVKTFTFFALQDKVAHVC